MAAYLTGQALLTACAAGRGVIIIVEGETEQEDAWFYSRWFADRATAVSFFPQNGWTQVRKAVEELRKELPHRRIFGIIDRDHAPIEAMAQQAAACPPDGVFRTQQFTLENHFLDADKWFRFLRKTNRGVPFSAFATEQHVADLISAQYQRCIPLSAYNLALRRESERLSTDGLPALRHVDAVPKSPPAALAKLATDRQSPLDLPTIFETHQASLKGLDTAQLAHFVDGDVVLKLVMAQLPLATTAIEAWKTHYIDHDPSPPTDLESLIHRILYRNGMP